MDGLGIGLYWPVGVGPRLPSRDRACRRSGRERGTFGCAERSEERLCRGLVLGRTRSCAGEARGGRVSLAPFAGAIPCRMIHLTSECSGRRFAPPLIRHISVTRSRNQDHVTEVASVGDVQTFQFSGVNGMMAFVRAVVCAAGMVLALAISFLPGIAAHPPIAIVTRAVIGVVACMMWAIWRRRGQEVRTDGSRIMWCPRRDRRVTMSWSQVEGIRERALRRRLELVDGSRGHLPLSYDLADFARLLEIVRRNTPRLRERHVLMSAFRPHPGVRWLYLAAALFSLALAAAAAVQGELFPIAVGLALSIVAVAAYGRTVRAIEVGPAGLVLAAPFRARHVAWRDVAGVALLHAKSEFGLLAGLYPTVRIQPRAGKPIDLGVIVEGTIPLFDAVEAAWRRAGTEPR